MAVVRRKIDYLYELIKDENIVHTRIKQLLTGIESAVSGAQREHNLFRKRAETTEEVAIATEKVAAGVQNTPKRARVPHSEKGR